MFNELKPLVVVLVLSAAVFALGRRFFEGFIAKADYDRRRNVWLALTCLGFGAPSIWIFAAVAMPVMFFAAKRDSNPLALYVLLMFVIPNTSVAIPTVGIGQLFDVNLLRMMAFVILIPVAWRKQGWSQGSSRFTLLDCVLAAYLLLQILLFIPYEAPTNTMRRALLLFIDTFVVYYAFARVRPTRQMLAEIAATVALVGFLLAPVAVFESLKGWLLYQGIPTNWGAPNVFAWLQRGDALRAQVSTGHSLVLGYTMSFCIAFWIYVQSQREKSVENVAGSILLCAGLVVSYSRGAWLMEILLVIAFMALRPGAGKVFVRVLPALAIVGVVMYLSPLKEVVLDRLPIIGTSDQDTIDYRRRLAEVSWQLIKLNPLLGDPFVTNSMEELRQGQGIIDLINGYIVVTLYSGFVGLSLFVTFFVVATWRCYMALRFWTQRESNSAVLGAALLACMLASLFFIATAGVGSIEYLLAGLMASYAATAQPGVARGWSPAPVRPRVPSGPPTGRPVSGYGG